MLPAGSWLHAVRGGLIVLALAAAGASAQVPGAIGPQGFQLAKEPRPVPPLHFQNEKGDRLTLEDFRGRVILLNIWATWCGPCREEMPTLEALQAELGGFDFEVVVLSIDKGIESVEDFYQEIGISRLNYYIDPSAKSSRKLGIFGIPTTLLVSRSGRELGRLVGTTDWHTPEMVEFLRGVIDRRAE